MQWYYNPGMLIVFHICSFQMSYGGGYMGLAESETIASYIISNIQFKELYCDFFE